MTLQDIPLDLIDRGPAQPRSQFDASALEELASSIERQGIIQPIVVRPHPSTPGRYLILAGERRWRAAGMAGLSEIPALVRDADDRLAAEIALTENLQREDLNPIEEAKAFARMVDEFGLTHEELALVLGKARTYVTNALRLLTLEDEVQELLERGTARQGLAAGYGKILAGVTPKT